MELLEKVKQRLFSQIDILDPGLSKEVVREKILNILSEIERKEKRLIMSEEVNEILQAINDELFGYSVLTPLITDPTITEIMINGPFQIYVEVNGRKKLSGVQFSSYQHLMQVLEKMLHHSFRRVDEMNPFTDFSLPDGSRVNVIIPPVSRSGPVITIRKFLRSFNSIEDLVESGSLTKEMGEFLISAIKARLNIVFSGATGAGKTTTLSVLLHYLDPEERVIVIEDTAELIIKHPHVVRLEARYANIEGKGEITIRDLFRNSLRMRPDRIVIGEVRGEESLDMLQAIASGHKGSLAVLHADNPRDAIARLETMVVIYNEEIPLWLVQKQIAQGIDLIVQQERMKDGVRRITYITEVLGADGNEVLLQDIFRFDQEGINEDGSVRGKWTKLNKEPQITEKMRKMGVEVKPEWFYDASPSGN